MNAAPQQVLIKKMHHNSILYLKNERCTPIKDTKRQKLHHSKRHALNREGAT
jgi:hypothetical protein